MNGEASDAEEDEGVDIDFGMVDGREQEPIGRWIKARRNLFGRLAEPGAAPGAAAGDKGKGKATSHDADPRAEDTEDEEDEDFTWDTSDDSESTDSGDEGSDASQDKAGDDEAEDSDASDEEGDDGEDDEEEDEEVQELDPKHHPLLRPGAMPKMSRAAVEAVVGMVEQDMMGRGRNAAAGDSDEDEEDELQD